jgi:histidyl-tRNA synthetase
MRRADKLGAQAVLIVGDDELQKASALARHGEQAAGAIALAEIVTKLTARKAG